MVCRTPRLAAAPGTLCTSAAPDRGARRPADAGRTAATGDGPIPAPQRPGACSASTALPPGRPVIATTGQPVVDEPAPGSCTRREAITLSVSDDTSPDIPDNSTAPARLPEPRRDDDESSRRTRCRPAPRSARSPPPSPSWASAPRSCARWPRPASCARSPSRSSPCRWPWPATTSSARPAPAWARRSASACRCCSGVIPPAEQPAANADGEAADRTKDVPQALVVVPTRELCVQVAKDLSDAGKHLGIRVTAIYGGRAYEPQLAALRRGVDVVVGTPGRLLDLAEQRHLVLGRVRPWCSTRPTRCSTWASCPTSSASCGCCRRSGTPCCSRPPCPARSSRCPARS